MSKYKIKPLVAQERLQTYVWEGTGFAYHYTWDTEETDVTTWERGFSETIGHATTLEAAQTIVDEHHQKEIEALLDLVLESPEAQLAALSAWVNQKAADLFDSKCQELVDEHQPATDPTISYIQQVAAEPKSMKTITFERLGKMHDFYDGTAYKPSLPLEKPDYCDLPAIEAVIISNSPIVVETKAWPAGRLTMQDGKLCGPYDWSALAGLSYKSASDEELLKEIAEDNGYVFGGIINPSQQVAGDQP